MLTEQQLIERKKFVTGSDAAVICGLSPYKTPVQLWLEKTGQAEAEDISDKNHIKFGNFMESGVASWFAHETGKQVEVVSDMLIHKSLSWMAGNIDGRIVGENALLECKTAYDDEGWGAIGDNTIPEHYKFQVMHYCAVGGFDRAYIAVVFARSREFRVYTYERDLEAEARLIEREQSFWIDNVLSGVAPEPLTSNDLLAIYKETEADPILATESIADDVRKLAQVKAERKSLEDEEKALAERIRLHMGEHDTLIDLDGKALTTWKYTKPYPKFDKAGVEKDYPGLIDKYTIKDDESTRRRNLLVKIKGK